jgi:hypothetical protein
MTYEIAYCECGEGIWDGQNFCIQCGKDLRKKEPQTTLEDNPWSE